MLCDLRAEYFRTGGRNLVAGGWLLTTGGGNLNVDGPDIFTNLSGGHAIFCRRVLAVWLLMPLSYVFLCGSV